MQVFRQTDLLPRGCAAALGYFDGLHIAHRELIRLAKESGYPCAVLTFSGNRPPYLTDESEKLALFEEAGADYVCAFDFEDIKDMPYDRFFNWILVGRLDVRALFCGYNYTFGKGALGGAAELTALCREKGIGITVTPEIACDGISVSSTNIKKMISAGELETANRLLGKPFSISGEVVHGQALGRQLGFPTLNLPYGDGRIELPHGVYFTECIANGIRHPAVTNVGTRPTVGGQGLLCETFLLDGSTDLYGKRINVGFLRFRRSEIKFESTDLLAAAVSKDITAAKEFFSI